MDSGTVTGKQPASKGLRRAGVVLTAALALLLIVLASRAVVSATTSAQMWAYPFQFDESEGMIVAETLLLGRGVPIYNTPGPELFIAAPYPPLFYLLNLPGQMLAGADPTFKVGRAISMLATLFVGIAIFGILVAATGDRLAGALGAAAWWSLALVTFWGSVVKPDMTAVALGLAGLWLLLVQPPKQFWLALPFFLAAFYTKQTAIAAAVAGIAWLLITRPRTGFKFGLAYAAGAFVPSALLTLATNGGYYWHEGTFNGIPGLPDPVHNLPWMPDRFAEFAQNFLLTYALIMVPGMLALGVAGIRLLAGEAKARFGRGEYAEHGPDAIEGKQRLEAREGIILPRSAPVLLLAYLAMSIVVASGTGTLGGNHNHLLDWAAAGCIGFGFGASALRRSRILAVRAGGVLTVGAVLLAVPTLFSNPAWMKVEFSLLQQDNKKQEGMMYIFQYVTNNGGPAYSDNVGLMLATRKKLWTTDPYTQTHATLYGRWDESKLVAEIKRKGFSQVILRIDIFAPEPGAGDVSPGILQALRDNYKLDQRNVENIYIPR